MLQESKELLKEKLAKKENIVLDATHYRKDFREKVIKIIEAYGGLPEIVFIFDTISNILIKDKNRKSTVGEAIIKNQLNKFEIPEISETPYITYIDLRKKD